MGDAVGVRETAWLSDHDPIKVGTEYYRISTALENQRVLLSISINASLLQNSGHSDIAAKVQNHGFTEQNIAGYSVYLASEDRVKDGFLEDRLDRNLIELDARLAIELAERGIAPCLAVVEVESVELGSPTKLWVKLWPALTIAGQKIREAEKDAFTIINRIVVYSAFFAWLWSQVALSGPQPDPVSTPEPCIPIEITELGTSQSDALCEEMEALLEQLRSQSESGRTQAQQKALKSVGIDPGPIDGKDGPQTRAARDKYAERHGLASWDTDPENLSRLLALEATIARVNLGHSG